MISPAAIDQYNGRGERGSIGSNDECGDQSQDRMIMMRVTTVSAREEHRAQNQSVHCKLNQYVNMFNPFLYRRFHRPIS